MEKVVLQKFISSSGHCSRRKAEELIRLGKVKVNGEMAELGTRVDENDEVKVGGRLIKNQNEKIYIILNKPEGYVCTNRKFDGEKNVFDLLVDKTGKQHALRDKLFVVGRLDKNSQGLVLLTNDGELAQKITHPKYGHEKVYLVKIRKSDSDCDFITKKLKQGIDIGEGDGEVKANKVVCVGNNLFEIVLTQGKKRQIRRMFDALGLKVEKLERTCIGGVCLNHLPVGKWECLCESDLKKLRK